MSSPLDLLGPSTRGHGYFPRELQLRSLRLPFLLLLFSLTAICFSCGGLVSVPPPPPPATVSVKPGSAQPFTGSSVQFSATVQNVATSAVNWLVNKVPGGNLAVGTIDSTGLYAAPTSVPTPPTVTITAVLQTDATASGSSSVTIQALSSIEGPLLLSPALSSLTTQYKRAPLLE
jgi:hypothetical protein